jgi:hypothetical protein
MTYPNGNYRYEGDPDDDQWAKDLAVGVISLIVCWFFILGVFAFVRFVLR